MIIGVPKEIKPQEHRVGAVPAMVNELVDAGHTVLVQSSAGVGAGLMDADFQAAGARMVGVRLGDAKEKVVAALQAALDGGGP